MVHGHYSWTASDIHQRLCLCPTPPPRSPKHDTAAESRITFAIHELWDPLRSWRCPLSSTSSNCAVSSHEAEHPKAAHQRNIATWSPTAYAAWRDSITTPTTRARIVLPI